MQAETNGGALMRYALWIVLLMLLAFSVGCKKPAENAQQAAVEKAIENASGGQVDVDISKGSTTVSDKKTGGTTTVDTSAAGGKMPAGWPKEVPQYPGSKVLASTSTDSTKGKQFMLLLETPDAVDAVLGYYDGKLTGAGYKKTAEIAKEDGKTRFYESDKLMAQFTIFKEGSVSKISLSLGPK
jgi:hypothetical protein